MKVGQVMSFLDTGLVPEEYREEFQRKLGALRDAAPTVTFKDMRKVIEEELGDRLSDVFEEFETELPETCPQCGGELLRRCKACGAPFSSLAVVDCEECGEQVRPNELFGSRIRRA